MIKLLSARSKERKNSSQKVGIIEDLAESVSNEFVIHSKNKDFSVL